MSNKVWYILTRTEQSGSDDPAALMPLTRSAPFSFREEECLLLMQYHTMQCGASCPLVDWKQDSR